MKNQDEGYSLNVINCSVWLLLVVVDCSSSSSSSSSRSSSSSSSSSSSRSGSRSRSRSIIMALGWFDTTILIRLKKVIEFL